MFRRSAFQPILYTGLLAAGMTASPTARGDTTFARESINLGTDSVRIASADQVYESGIRSRRTHPNGDVSIELFALPDGQPGLTGHLTLGRSSVFGHVQTPKGPLMITTDARGSRWTPVPEQGVEINRCGLNHGPSKHRASPGRDTIDSATTTVVDLLLIYNDAFAKRYPGDVLGTRLNHLVHIANRTFGNSGLDAVIRLVGSEAVGYRNDNSNFDFRNDIASALAGEAVPGLEGLAAQRDALGADLVIGLRPHDIETRGSCGIAFFPEGDANIGVNVVSDGVSSWSFCLDDVLTHEIGHNLGATHQLGAGGGLVDPVGSAFVQPGRFTTVMGSFGTGRPDRFRGLAMFSNPRLPCGNEACGRALDTDNVTVINRFLPEVAAYRSQTTTLPAPPVLEREASDQDNDGVIDWNDALPFDPSEILDDDRDGRGNDSDAFPRDAREQDDTDGDGIGDVADADDDGDGAEDVVDAFPLDATEQSDTDRDGVGDVADVFPLQSAVFRDTDGDGIGDNQDADIDGDGVEERDPFREDLLVVSIDKRQILRFDAMTGAARGVEVPAWDSRITFQSRLAWRPIDDTLVYTGDSGLRRLDLRDRTLLGTWVPPYDDSNPSGVQLSSGFPVGLATLDGGRRVIVTRLGNPVLGTFQGLEQARGEPFVTWQLDIDEAPGDMTSDGTTAYILGPATRSIYEVDNRGPRLLAGPELDWMRDPTYIALTDDERLLVSDQGRNTVVALDRDSGAFLGDFIRLGEECFDRPSGLAVTEEGVLLVGAGRQDAILAYDASSGAFQGVRVQGNGLDQPGDLVLVPSLQDRFPRDDRRTLRPNPGLWSDVASDGRGFDIQVFGNRLSAIWYSYDSQGDPTWTLAAGELVGEVFQAPLQRFTLSPGSDGPARAEDVGSLTITFSSEREARADWTLEGISGTDQLGWLVFTPRLRQVDNTGLWGREDGPGWGLSLASQGGVTVAVAYAFDETGAPRWAISEPVSGNPPYRFDMLASFAPGLCPGCGGGTNELVPAGTMQLDLGANPIWTSDVIWPAPLEGGWKLQGIPVIRSSETPVRPR